MINKYTIQQFKDKYEKQDVVTYNPEDIIRGDYIMVLDEDSLWKPAMFIEEIRSEKKRFKEIHAIIDDEVVVRIFKKWAVIEG